MNESGLPERDRHRILLVLSFAVGEGFGRFDVSWPGNAAAVVVGVG